MKQILIVEDDSLLNKMLTYNLTADGYSVTSVLNARTANDQESDQIRGYEAGAVDYITKPFVLGALQRKIKAMLSMLEHHRTTKDVYDDGRLVLDFSEQSATLNGTPVNLSAMEYRMLNLFRKNPRQVLTRGLLLEKLWDVDEKYVDEHTLTTTISRIRSKIESDGGAPYIKTVYGMGYQWTGGEAK
ncbi:sensory transduction protein regX3 [Lachnospiraceae bacterium]|nr:sensory transduction protein regX3 [Lachnospiraceae bacterium]